MIRTQNVVAEVQLNASRQTVYVERHCPSGTNRWIRVKALQCRIVKYRDILGKYDPFERTSRFACSSVVVEQSNDSVRYVGRDEGFQDANDLIRPSRVIWERNKKFRKPDD